MDFDTNLVFWPALTLIFAIPTLIFIPRQEYKRFFIFGFILGGFIDILTIIFIGNLLGEFSYSAGPLEVLGIPLLVPLIFTFVWMNFLYFLPVRIEFLIPYILNFIGFSILVGFVEQNLGYFKYNFGFVHGAIMTGIVFAVWLSFSVWVYRHYLKLLP